jgi:hypothetical protein
MQVSASNITLDAKHPTIDLIVVSDLTTSESSGDPGIVAGTRRIPDEADCPSSDNLRLIRRFEKGGSGSSGVRV